MKHTSTQHINRRRFGIGGLKSAAALMAVGFGAKGYSSNESGMNFEITRSEQAWRQLLTENEYLVLREEKTERPFSSALNDEKRDGIYHCAGCDLPAYSSVTKYDSGTGWPSFWDSLPNAIGTKEDNKLFSTRTEVHCRRCGGHFGHIFDDGPQPTGERHCLNGLALTFRPS